MCDHRCRRQDATALSSPTKPSREVGSTGGGGIPGEDGFGGSGKDRAIEDGDT